MASAGRTHQGLAPAGAIERVVGARRDRRSQLRTRPNFVRCCKLRNLGDLLGHDSGADYHRRATPDLHGLIYTFLQIRLTAVSDALWARHGVCLLVTDFNARDRHAAVFQRQGRYHSGRLSGQCLRKASPQSVYCCHLAASVVAAAGRGHGHRKPGFCSRGDRIDNRRRYHSFT